MREPDSPSPRRRPARAAPRGRTRGVGEIVPAIGAASFRRFGFVQAEIVARWAEIVGERYARHSLPESLGFPQGRRAGGTLTVTVESAFAPMLQHVEPQVIERVNRMFGYAAVVRVALRHGAVPPPPESRRPTPAAPLPEAMSGSLKPVSDPGLRAALESLARALCETKGPPVVE